MADGRELIHRVWMCGADTQMQALIREQGPTVMSGEELTKFKGLHERGELLDPEVYVYPWAKLTRDPVASLRVWRWLDQRSSAENTSIGARSVSLHSS